MNRRGGHGTELTATAAGELVTRGSRRQKNLVSWPDEKAAMLDRAVVIDRGSRATAERKPRAAIWLARARRRPFHRNIDPPVEAGHLPPRERSTRGRSYGLKSNRGHVATRS